MSFIINKRRTKLSTAIAIRQSMSQRIHKKAFQESVCWGVGLLLSTLVLICVKLPADVESTPIQEKTRKHKYRERIFIVWVRMDIPSSVSYFFYFFNFLHQ